MSRPIRLLLSAVLFTLLCAPAWSQPAETLPAHALEGSWLGTLLAAQYDPLEIVFHLHSDAGSYTATLDIPSQARHGLQADTVSVRGGNILIRLNTLQAEYYATLEFAADGNTVTALDGDWSQSGEHVPLRMQRQQRQAEQQP